MKLIENETETICYEQQTYYARMEIILNAAIHWCDEDIEIKYYIEGFDKYRSFDCRKSMVEISLINYWQSAMLRRKILKNLYQLQKSRLEKVWKVLINSLINIIFLLKSIGMD